MLDQGWCVDEAADAGLHYLAHLRGVDQVIRHRLREEEGGGPHRDPGVALDSWDVGQRGPDGVRCHGPGLCAREGRSGRVDAADGGRKFP